MWPGGSLRRQAPAAGALVVGRGPDVELCVEHRSISRRHAKITIDARGVTIEDLGSMNGTVVNGARAEPGVALALPEGGVAQVGDALIALHDEAPEAPEALERGAAGDRVVADEVMRQLYRMVELVAKSQVNVLVHGETGAGKEVIAEALHRASSRAARPFLGINCAALPEALLETELFGHERGAFTGAVSAKAGLLEAASGGTVFLDEIAEMPAPAQAKLLRVLEKREVMRVGSVKVTPVDVRFVAATHHDLRALVAEGRFREDLFFRLDGITLEVPPLRERPREIEALARAFLEAACKATGRAGVTMGDEALALLRAHAWPGNVRELRNVVERALLLCQGDAIGAEHIVTGALSAQPKKAAPSSRSLADEVADLERRRILEALEQAGGNQTEAAQLLGVPRRTLIARLEQYGVPRPRKR
ncbi:MAG: sigma 54-interacting transcriptional regulator [Labilithrix sp.]|nr:sigma 54-interacting transcriptional regulator [Labilithrix sp.]MCW5815998.1 sigma 54-interacting transcriptional regulator [Labilithrix sp.]